MAPDAILGRQEELDVIGRILDAPPAGPRAVLLEGEAGIGKSTLWHEAVRIAGARGHLVLFARVAEAEAKLSFTVLTDLLEPVAGDVLTELPPPQQRALTAALLLDEGEGSLQPDARAVSLGALGSVQALASRGPITIAIDDVQWTDTPSARALAFCLRRLVNEPVTVLAARRLEPGLRDPSTSFQRCVTIAGSRSALSTWQRRARSCVAVSSAGSPSRWSHGSTRPRGAIRCSPWSWDARSTSTRPPRWPVSRCRFPRSCKPCSANVSAPSRTRRARPSSSPRPRPARRSTCSRGAGTRSTGSWMQGSSVSEGQ